MASNPGKRRKSAAPDDAAPTVESAGPDATGDGAGDAPSIDAVLEGLEAVVTSLERGDLPLEAALARFEEGVRLARTGGRLLDGVEQRVEVLLAERDEVVSLDLDGDDAD